MLTISVVCSISDWIDSHMNSPDLWGQGNIMWVPTPCRDNVAAVHSIRSEDTFSEASHCSRSVQSTWGWDSLSSMLHCLFSFTARCTYMFKANKAPITKKYEAEGDCVVRNSANYITWFLILFLWIPWSFLALQTAIDLVVSNEFFSKGIGGWM